MCVQYQSFVQFRGKLKSRSSEEIQRLKETPTMWNIHSMINVLYSLVDKSNINKQVCVCVCVVYVQGFIQDFCLGGGGFFQGWQTYVESCTQCLTTSST